MKYKINQNVVIRKDLRTKINYFMDNSITSNVATNNMLRLAGQTVKIIEYKHNQYKIDAGPPSLCWTDDMLKSVEESNDITPPIHHFNTVGELRNALIGLPDDKDIYCQVVAKDGKAWYMQGEIYSQAPQNTSALTVLTLKHDDLKTLPTP